MTDEMTIQPQVRQKSPVMPALLAGGVGAAAGFGGSYWYEQSKGAKSYEELVAEVKDKTDFSSKKEPAKWSDFKKQAEKVAELERKLAEAPEKVLPETDALAIKRNNLQTQFDQRLAQMVEDEEAKLGKTTISNIVSESRLNTVLNAAEAGEISTELKAYNDAVADLRANSKANYAKAYKTVREDAEKLYTTQGSGTLKNNAKTAAEAVFPEGAIIKSHISGKPVAEQLAYAEKLAQEQGNIYSISSKYARGSVKITDAYGAGKHAYLVVDKAALTEAREGLVEAYIENAARYKEINTELENIAKEFFNKNQTALKDMGITDVKELATKLKSSKELTQYIENLEAKIQYAERNGASTFKITNAPKGRRTTFTTLEDARKVLEKSRSELDLARQYTELRATLRGEQIALVNADPRVVGARTKFHNAVRNDAGIKKAIEGLKSKLNNKYLSAAKKAEYEAIWAKLQPLLEAEGSAATATVDKAALEQLLKGQKLGQDLEKAIADYNAALTERGVSNTAAREALQKEANAAKAEAQKLAEGLAHKKLPKGWIAAGVGAACAVIALMCSNKNN